MKRFHWLWWRQKHVYELNEGNVVIYLPKALSQDSITSLRHDLEGLITLLPLMVTPRDEEALE